MSEEHKAVCSNSNDLLYGIMFHAACTTECRPGLESFKDVNIQKNRYSDAYPSDESRVVLHSFVEQNSQSDDESEDSSSDTSSTGNSTSEILLGSNFQALSFETYDYINASFIPGLNNNRCYIAAQGPLEHTVFDFYRMIWEYNVISIVMLTNWVERGTPKCFMYLPKTDKLEISGYGDLAKSKLIIKVKNKEVARKNLFITTLSIIDGGANSPEKIFKHFHYIGWPDQGVPKSDDEIGDLLTMRKIVNSWQKTTEKSPIVVHCSAGIGRTGTYLAIDYNLCRKEANKKTYDVFSYTCLMRELRTGMIQTKDQFKFVHHVLTVKNNF